jgi:hypothetical protein
MPDMWNHGLKGQDSILPRLVRICGQVPRTNRSQKEERMRQADLTVQHRLVRAVTRFA